MTKTLRNINSWWIRHAWTVLGAALVALTFFVSLVVLGQISPSSSRASRDETDYAKQKDRIDKLEQEVKDLNKALDRREDTSLETTEPNGVASASVPSPDRAQIQVHSPATGEMPHFTGGRNGQNYTSTTSPTPRPAAPSVPEEPAMPTPSTTTAPSSGSVIASAGVDVQRLMKQLSCGLNGTDECR